VASEARHPRSRSVPTHVDAVGGKHSFSLALLDITAKFTLFLTALKQYNAGITISRRVQIHFLVRTVTSCETYHSPSPNRQITSWAFPASTPSAAAVVSTAAGPTAAVHAID